MSDRVTKPKRGGNRRRHKRRSSHESKGPATQWHSSRPRHFKHEPYQTWRHKDPNSGATLTSADRSFSRDIDTFDLNMRSLENVLYCFSDNTTSDSFKKALADEVIRKAMGQQDLSRVPCMLTVEDAIHRVYGQSEQAELRDSVLDMVRMRLMGFMGKWLEMLEESDTIHVAMPEEVLDNAMVDDVANDTEMQP